MHLIIPALLHLYKFNCFGCLIFPFWPSSIILTFLADDGVHFNNFVSSFVKLSPDFVSGEHVQSSTFKGGPQKFKTYAIYFTFSSSSIFLFQEKSLLFAQSRVAIHVSNLYTFSDE